MSKLQAALKKMANANKARPGIGDAAATVRSAVEAANRHVVGKDAVNFSRHIDVDFDALIENGAMIAKEHQREFRDELRRIKWPVLANAFGDQSAVIPRGNVVMVASAVSGEGKTFLAVNLAMAIAAEKDIDVLLVDADIAKPHASDLFGVGEYTGVIEYLSGETRDIADVIVGTDVPGLSVMPSGRADEHASELIASKRMETLVTELSDRLPNTVVLFDTSPVLLTNESLVLSRLVGQVLLVIAANKTPQSAVREAVSLFGTDIPVNVIFNGLTNLFGKKYGYGGYYGYESRR